MKFKEIIGVISNFASLCKSQYDIKDEAIKIRINGHDQFMIFNGFGLNKQKFFLFTPSIFTGADLIRNYEDLIKCIDFMTNHNMYEDLACYFSDTKKTKIIDSISLNIVYHDSHIENCAINIYT